MTLDAIETAARAEHLSVFGAFHPRPQDATPEGCATLVLLGPHEPGYWDHVTASPEWRSGAPDPIDRWSTRVIGALARRFDAEPLFPFGGPPYQPFIRWALASNQAWQSPVSLLVHRRAGLMVSYRGALALPVRLEVPPPASNPCEPCHKPCLTACAVGALGSEGYDVAACHAYLDTQAGQDNLAQGCAVRRACPLSHSYGRELATSAYHMAQFHST